MISLVARKAAVAAVGGTLVVFSATLAMASTNDDPFSSDSGAELEAGECVREAEPSEQTADGVDVETTPEDDPISDAVESILGPDAGDDEGEDASEAGNEISDCDAVPAEEDHADDDQDGADDALEGLIDPPEGDSTLGGDEPSDDDVSAENGERIYRNHGEAVSEAAKTCPKGTGRGACVSAVARSDVGKKAKADKGNRADKADKADKGNG